MSILVLGKIRMLFRELWSLCAPVWTSCLRYWGDFLWITLCTKVHYYTEDALLKVMDHTKGALVQLALAKQHKEL